MRLLSREEFELAKPYLRCTIPNLFDGIERVDRPLYETRYANPNSMMGALAVQRLAGGVIRSVDLNGSSARKLQSRLHVLNDISGEGDLFDVFGFTPSQDRKFISATMLGEPLQDPDGLTSLVERVLDPVRYELGLPVEVLK